MTSSESIIVIIILFSISLFVTVPAHAVVLTLHFDQTTIMLNHSDVITYISSAGTSPSPVTISGGNVAPMTITLDQMPGSTTVWRKMVNFTTCTSNNLPALKYCVNPNTTITIINNGGSDSAIISNVIQPPDYGNRRSINDPITCVNDVDQDGICDEWESSTTLSIPGAGSTFTYSCPASMPCGPDRKDIFVEIDYMIGHRPNQEAIDAVVAAFNNAPTTAPPGGTSGIRLHVQIDDAETMGHIDSTQFPGTNTAPGFDQIKATHFGTLTERQTTTDWVNTGWKLKKQAFHYFLFAHSQIGGSDKSSGIAEVLGNDALITLGSFDGQIGTPDQQAGTLMHELGHNLNLNHGGAAADTVNCKPNYLSLMSYSRQFNDLVTDRALDFSHQQIPSTGTIGETGVNENPALQSYTFKPTERMIWNKDGATPSLAYGPSGITVDWNGDTIITPSSSYNIDLNNIGTFCLASPNESYGGYNDWANINLKFKASSGNFADGRASGTSTKLDVGSEQCPPLHNFVSRDASPQQVDNIQKLHRVCSGGIGTEPSLYSPQDKIPTAEPILEINETNFQLVKDLPESVTKEFNNTSFGSEMTSTDVLEIRIYRIDQLKQQVENLDSKLFDSDSKNKILHQYDEAKSQISKNESALAYQALNVINYNSIKNSTIAQQLNDETNDVNKMFSEAPAKQFSPTICQFGESRSHGVCETNYTIEGIIIAIIIIIIILIFWIIVIRPRQLVNKGHST